MIRQTRLILLGAILLASLSCSKDFNAPDNRPEVNPETGIPYSFDWSLTQSVTLNVSVSPIDGETDNLVRTIKVYRSPLFVSSELLAVGSARPDAPFRTTLIVPSALKEVYVQEILPNGIKTARIAQIMGGGVDLNVRKYASVNDRSVLSSMPQAPVVTAPESYDVVIDAQPAQTIVLGNDDKTSYLIPAGVTIEGNVSMSNWHSSQCALYVAGTLKISGYTSIEKSSLIVLEGGRVELGSTVANQNEAAVLPTIYVERGGYLSMADVNISSNNKLVNYGTIKTTGNTSINNTNVIYNLGEIEAAANTRFVFDNNCTLHNDGTLRADYLEVNSDGRIYCYENSVVEAKTYNQTNSTNTLLVKGTFTVEGTATLHGKSDIYCSLTAGRMELNSNDDHYTMYPGSYTAVKTALINGSTIAMDGALIEIGTLDQGWSIRFTGGDQAWSVARIDNPGDWRWGRCSGTGNIEFVTSAAAEHPDNYQGMLSEGARMVPEQTVDITATDCNQGKGQITPDVDINDKDGDGVPDSEDIDDEDPEVAYRVDGSVYTYCFEDKWPWKGDYDMNDLVLALRAEQITNAQNQVVYLNLYWEAKAVGSYNNVAAAICLDAIAASEVASVVADNTLTGSAPFASEQGLERGAKQAILPLFNNARDVMGNYTTYANTEKGKAHVATTEHTTKLKFAAPVDPASVAVDKLNVFIVSNERDESLRGKEIHLPGYAATEFATQLTQIEGVIMSLTERYKTSDGLMWALMIPGDFRYPTEFSDISTVYTHFVEWARSGGVDHTDWYESDCDEDLVY